MKKLIAIGILVGAVTSQARGGAGDEVSRFIRGDANCDLLRDISDPIYALNFLFRSGPSPCCLAVLDTNADGGGDISDAITDLNFLFVGIGSIPQPFPDCGSVQGADCPLHPCNAAPPVAIDWVTIGDPGNSPDDTGYGAVAETYRIAKFEVTNAQWAAFLNTVDPEGTNELKLFVNKMDTDPIGGIEQTPPSASGAKYVVKEGRGDRPVVYVSWMSVVRFCNWLHNGQGGPGSTENGAYERIGGGTITGVGAIMIERTSTANFFLPTKNEWYKAAYFQPDNGSYSDYGTQSNTEPTAQAPPGDANSANLELVVNDVTDVGAYSNALSAYGTFDQCGNVWEWREGTPEILRRPVQIGGWPDSAETCASTEDRFIVFDADDAGFNFLGFRPAARP